MSDRLITWKEILAVAGVVLAIGVVCWGSSTARLNACLYEVQMLKGYTELIEVAGEAVLGLTEEWNERQNGTYDPSADLRGGEGQPDSDTDQARGGKSTGHR